MATTATIQRSTLTPGLGYDSMRKAMLDHVLSLARRVWTDLNVHDPGITAIELLCYALTDLSYRASFPIEDLLTNAQGAIDGESQAFFTPRTILSNRPLTLLDYRKLLIDLPNVKNAWLKTASVRFFADPAQAKLLRTHPGSPGIRLVDIRGLYQVLLDLDEGISADARQEAIDSARQKLHQNRNLCENFTSFDVVQTQSFMLCAELELLPTADAATVQAQVLFEVQQYLAPAIPVYSLAEMLVQQHADGSPRTVDQIFDGPALNSGFTSDEDLERADLREEIRLSDIISIIMDVPGVLAVRDIVVNPVGTTLPLENKWNLTIEVGKKALLDRVKSRLVFYKKNMPLMPSAEKVEAQYMALVAEQRSKSALPDTDELDYAIPSGIPRETSRYYSFQNHFPAVYGIGEAGLSSDADDRRKALALQLKAYLLFFDQVLADYLAQLSHVRDLFSTDAKLQPTYFWQRVELSSSDDAEKVCPKARQQQKMNSMLEDERLRNARRNRFLDHLIARFAEQFQEYVSVMQSVFGASVESVIATKCEFLKDYPSISSERALGYDILGKPSERWNSANVSGLEKRLSRLLGITDVSRRSLTGIVRDEFAKVEPGTPGTFRFRLLDESAKVLLGSTVDFPSEEEADEKLKRALHYAQIPESYKPTTPGGKFSFDIVDGSNELVAQPSGPFDTEALRDAAIQEIVKFVRAHYPEGEEGMFLIENILLLPGPADDRLLPICVDPNCTDCADDDPYSYRIHVVLPAYAGRFKNMDFRRYAEEVIREETPAHILPKICWVDSEDMRRLEEAYRAWLEQDPAASAEKTEKLGSLIEALFQVKNVYPSNKLHDCAAGDEEPRFILGQTALGTEKTKDS